LTRTDTSFKSGVSLVSRCGSGYLGLPAIECGRGRNEPHPSQSWIAGRFLANRLRVCQQVARSFDRELHTGPSRRVAIHQSHGRNRLNHTRISEQHLLLSGLGAHLTPIARSICGSRAGLREITERCCAARCLEYHSAGADFQLRPSGKAALRPV
jgi:hypothetical protein